MSDIVRALKRLTYSPTVGAVVRRLHLRGVARALYFRLNASRDARFSATANGTTIFLSARDPIELRTVEVAWLSEEKFIQLVVGELRPGDTLFDVGSNLGLFSMFGAAAVGPTGCVAAFEPEARAYSRLQRNIELNRFANVRAFHLALSDQRGTLRLVAGGEADVSQTSHLTSGEDGEGAVVDVWPGDDVVAQHGLPIPSLVKVDVEGHEYSVLRGLRGTLADPRCRMLLCELHPRVLPSGVTVERIVDLVREIGFTRVDVEPRGNELHLIATRPG